MVGNIAIFLYDILRLLDSLIHYHTIFILRSLQLLLQNVIIKTGPEFFSGFYKTSIQGWTTQIDLWAAYGKFPAILTFWAKF
jgi:hypothetical protein